MANSSVIESLEQYERERQPLEDYYWLRFLELETRSEATKRRESVSSKKLDKMGQSIFTVTKRLRKEEENLEFGFENYIAWTKPCVISKVEKDSPADMCHLEPGDFIIFIDKINVVDMVKDEILNRINKADVLTLEVFRRASIKSYPNIPPIVEAPVVVNRRMTISVHEESTIDRKLSSVHEESVSEKTVVYAEVKKNRLTSTESKRKQLVTFSKDESTTTSGSIDSQRSIKILGSLLQLERQFVETLNFGANRYVNALKNRKDLLSSKEHEVLFKSIEGIKAVMEVISNRENPEQIVQAYRQNGQRFIEEYEKYFLMIKAADSIVVEKTHHPEFIKFIANPSVPSSQPIFHNFLQRPIEYFSELQKNFQILLGQYRLDCQEYDELNQLINQLQTAYKSSMAKAAKTKVEIKPLLCNLESRLVFTKCKPFKLDIPGRQWVFAGDLTKIEGNSLEKPAYTLLFNDIILFSTINRDRVMFITEEPIFLKSVVETFFNIRKKETEFRLTIETNPNYKDTSPTTHCTPDLIKSPLRQSRRRNIFIRAPSEEIKKIWQNLITQQVFNINSPTSNNHVDTPSVSLLIKNPSTQTDNFTNVSTNTKETENISSYGKSNIYAHANGNQLNLKSQNAFDLGDSLVTEEEEEGQLETPETPSCANLSSLNGKFQKSLSTFTFSSLKIVNSDCGESCGDIFNDFDSSDISFANDVEESVFM